MAQGMHYLQIPGPSPVPERIQRAIDRQVIDHRSATFQKLGREVLEAIREPFGTRQPVIIFPASGTGAWEAAIANTLSSGDRVLMVETGQFAVLWGQIAKRWGLQVEMLETDWRHGVNPGEIEARLSEDKAHTIKAVMVVHNETATSCASDIGAVRKAKSGDGQYLWTDSLIAGTPPSFNSRPIVEDPELEDIGAGKRVMIFGDLSYFKIYDRVGLNIMRDDYSRAKFGEVRFWGRRRTGAGLTLPEAVRTLKIGTSV